MLHIIDLIERYYLQQNKESIACVYRFLTEMKQTRICAVKVKRLAMIIKSKHYTDGILHTPAKFRQNMERSVCCLYKKLLTGKNDVDFSGISPHLDGGLAGIGMYLLGILDSTHKSWLKLL